LIFCLAQRQVPLYTQLCDLVSTTALGEFIANEKFSAHSEKCMELYNSYLNDFVKSVYWIGSTQECEVEVFVIYINFGDVLCLCCRLLLNITIPDMYIV